ncbi:hypothetical protein NC652_022967 [Populus alba x Populus x berolinensis]|nr:hypothetical protein NC652_022967 [Populus alba x Populus x berolinensis]
MGKWVFCVVFRFKLDVFIHGYFNPEFPLDDFLKQSKKDRFIYKILSRKIHLDLDYISEIFRDHEKQKRKWCLTDSVSCSTSEDVRGTQRDFGDQDAKAKYQNWSFEYVLLVPGLLNVDFADVRAIMKKMQALLFWEPASKRSRRQNLLFSDISSSSFLWAIYWMRTRCNVQWR